jgi:hypothetical protein
MHRNRRTDFTNHLDLRIEREIRGISLEDISRDTRLSLTQLKDFEARRFGRLPNDMILRSLVKMYTQKLGLDPDMVILEYPLHRDSATRDRPANRRVRKLVHDIQIGPLTGFFLITMALLIFLWPSKMAEFFRKSDAEPGGISEKNMTMAEAMNFFDTCFRRGVSLQSNQEQQDIAILSVKPGDLSLTVTEPTWIRVDNMTRGINSLFALFPGDVKTVRIEDETVIRFDNPESVSLTHNDRDVLLEKKLPVAIQFIPENIHDIIPDDIR